VILDDEVFAVIMAIVVVASIFAFAMVISPSTSEPFTAIGLLNSECKIGEYPVRAVLGDNVTLCIFVDNHMGRPIYYRVVYKIGSSSQLPTNTSPSPSPEVLEWRGVLDNGINTTFKVVVPVWYGGGEATNRSTMIFELWVYNTDRSSWEYTGRWVHLHIELMSPRG